MLISIAFTNLKNNWIIQLAQGFLTFSDWRHPSLLIEHIGGTPIYNLLVSRPQVQKMPALRLRTTELANQMIWNCVKYCDVTWHILTYSDIFWHIVTSREFFLPVGSGLFAGPISWWSCPQNWWKKRFFQMWVLTNFDKKGFKMSFERSLKTSWPIMKRVNLTMFNIIKVKNENGIQSHFYIFFQA